MANLNNKGNSMTTNTLPKSHHQPIIANNQKESSSQSNHHIIPLQQQDKGRIYTDANNSLGSGGETSPIASNT